MEHHKVKLRSKWTKHGFYHWCGDCEREVRIDCLGRRKHIYHATDITKPRGIVNAAQPKP